MALTENHKNIISFFYHKKRFIDGKKSINLNIGH